MESKKIISYSLNTIQRMPAYLRVLNQLRDENIEYVSSNKIGELLNLKPILVKKDLGLVTSQQGKPRLGFKISILISDIETFLGYDNSKDALIIGVGHLGRALLSYPGFKNYGVNICLGFDIDNQIIGKTIDGVTIMPMSKLEDLTNRLHIHIAIICVPKEFAQEIVDRLATTCIRAIWNWAPIDLNVPSYIAVKNEDIATSLAVLTNKMKEIMKRK